MISVTKFILALFFAQCLAAQNESTTNIEGPLDMLECSQVEIPGFTVVDYIVVLGVLVISLGIGIFYAYFQKAGSSSNEFLLGSEMSVFPVTLSLMTSFITAIELLGNPSEMYFHGTQFVLIGKLMNKLSKLQIDKYFNNSDSNGFGYTGGCESFLSNILQDGSDKLL